VAMADLRQLLADLGYTNVRTHLQSGNALFDALERSAAKVRSAIESAIRETLGLELKVLVRTRGQLADVIAANEMPTTDGKKLHVAFLDEAPTAASLRDVDPAGYLPEQFQVGAKELYLWCANGVIESKIMKVLTEKRLQRVITARNWNTVAKLHELLAEGD
jgi:uncharacterized protein (DUF1697 family)